MHDPVVPICGIDPTLGSSEAEPLPESVQLFRHSSDPSLCYFAALPEEIRPDAPIIVSVHGISRNARAHILAFAGAAEQAGAVVVAPVFSASAFPAYQRLGRRGRGIRADLALDAILGDLARRTGITTRRIHLTGYSGGAQFAHRFALANPGRIEKLAICSAGWFTFPDESRPYPRGLGERPEYLDVKFALPPFLRIPTLVLVGELDTNRDETLNRSRKIDRQQGRTRRERAERWVDAIRAKCREMGLPPRIYFELVAGYRHSFEHNADHADDPLPIRILEWFLGPPEEAARDVSSNTKIYRCRA